MIDPTVPSSTARPGAPESWKLLLPWIALFALAVGVRLIFMAQTMSSPFFESFSIDAQWHANWARSISAGRIAQEQPFFRAPLYPIFLALWTNSTDPTFLLARIVQHVLGAAACLGVVRIGMRVYGAAVGWLAGGVCALYAPLWYFENELLIPALVVPLFVFTLLATLRANERSTGGAWLLAGLLLGLCAIARPNFLLLAPVVGVWCLWRAGRGRFVWWQALSLTSGVVMPILPVLWHNVHYGGEWVLIASQGGVNFYIGNNPQADGRTAVAPGEAIPALDDYVDNVMASSRSVAEQDVGQPLGHAAVSRYWFRRAFEFWQQDPGAALTLLMRKLYYLVNGFELESNRSLYIDRDYSSLFEWSVWSRGLTFPAGLLIPLAAVGFVLPARQRSGANLLRAVALVYAATIVAFFVTGRFRMPLVPVAALFAAQAAVSMWNALRIKRWQPMRFMVVGTALAVALSNSSFLNVTDVDLARRYSLQGTAHVHLGEYAEAALCYAQSLSADNVRSGGPRSHAMRYADQFNLALCYQRLNQTLVAIEQMKRAVQIHPLAADGHCVLADLYAEQGAAPLAEQHYRQAIYLDPDDTAASVNLADLLLRRHRFKDALEVIRLPLELAPNRPQYHYIAGMAAQGIGDNVSAVRFLEQTLRLNSAFSPALLPLGQSLMAIGQTRPAEEVFSAAADRDPADAHSRFMLGQLYYTSGRMDESHDVLAEALRIEPDNGPGLCHMAAVQVNLGDPENARHFLDRAIAIEAVCDPAVSDRIRTLRPATDKIGP
jgi:tetratricopeptide (TPR) repeat protein